MPTLQLPAYTPALYLPGSYGRYWTYNPFAPYNTTTPIPGAGYRPARLRWGEQELNLDGARPGKRYVYGNYARGGGVPLLGLGGYLGQTPSTVPAVAQVTPEESESAFAKFATIARRIWGEPAPIVHYSPRSATAGGSTTLQFGQGVPAINYGALVDYAKITAVGTFIGVPVAAALGAWVMHRSMAKKTATANRSRRRRRR